MNNANFGNADITRKKKNKFRIIPFIISLFISFLLWNYVMMVESPTREVTFDSIPITVIKGENSLAVISGASTTVNITVRGKKSLTAGLTNDDFKITADISDLAKYSSAGEYSNVPIKIELPDELSLVTQSADSVTLYLDNKEVKSVPVKVNFPGSRTFENGCELALDYIELSQSEINVTGPSSVISRIESALLTIPIEGNVDSSKTFSGTPVLVDANGEEVVNSYLTTDVSTISGKVPVYMTKEIPLSIEYKYGYFTDNNISVKIEPETVTVKGDIEKVKALENLVVTTLDEKKFTSEFVSSMPTLDGIELITPVETVSIIVDSSSFTEKTVHIDNITVSNPNNLKYSIPEGGISVKLMGTKNAVSQITSSDISAVLDLSGISSLANGAQNAPVTVKIASAYTGVCWEKGEYSILVSAEE